ncbi:BTB/POZ domain-containing protein 6-B isoform X2 [Hyalella azteca]|uniref:BTB/POZ domain-containing protein 6-B isoform X2 n=1 Tax=Hyalella azteca TaxID=294128 RepID=A0A979FJ57_HYAAZ|nr:BTB/POZ domain-containing protein 6-B isoform X2 [Hyalella azteca]
MWFGMDSGGGSNSSSPKSSEEKGNVCLSQQQAADPPRQCLPVKGANLAEPNNAGLEDCSSVLKKPSLLSKNSGNRPEGEGLLNMAPLLPPLLALQQIQRQDSDPSAESAPMTIVQPSSAPTSPSHRYSDSPPSPSPKSPGHRSMGGMSTIASDPNFLASSLRERNAAMLNNELMADVHFVVGPQPNPTTFPAHRYVLAVGSSVFYAMFYGGLKTEEEVIVPDVEPQAFLTLLRYLYCDEVVVEADTVLATLYAAKKYLVPHLAAQCVKYLEVSLTARNACLLLSQSRLFEEPELMTRCWEVIDAQAEMALQSDGFVDIDYPTLLSVLSRETLNCREIVLFEAALNWAEAECERQGLECTPVNKRKVLGEALSLIRLPCMELTEFANGAAQSGLLSLQETTDLFLYFTAFNKPAVSYPTKHRTGLRKQVCHRFQSCAYRSNQWRYRGRVDSINFMVDRRIFVVGFGLYGSSSGAADYTVRIELKKYGEVLASHSTKFFSDGSSTTFPVYFPHPVQVERDVYYTASAILDGTELSYFGQEGVSEVSLPCVSFMFHCSSESTNGTGVQGGQIPELIFYGPTTEREELPEHRDLA